MSKETFLSFYREHIARAGSAELLEYLERSDFLALRLTPLLIARMKVEFASTP